MLEKAISYVKFLQLQVKVSYYFSYHNLFLYEFIKTLTKFIVLGINYSVKRPYRYWLRTNFGQRKAEKLRTFVKLGKPLMQFLHHKETEAPAPNEEY